MRKKIFISAFSILLAIFSRLGAGPARKPVRIVSLMPSNTEILFALGAGSEVVGVTNYCDYPPEAQRREKVGDFIHPNLEKTVSLKPDIVLAGDWPSSQIVPRLRRAGVKVVEVPLPATLEQIYETIDQVGRVVAREKEARILIEDLKKRVDQIESRAKRRKTIPRLYIDIDDVNWTISKQSFISDAVERCGMRNVFRDLSAAGAQVSDESVIERDPEVILISGRTRETILRRKAWRSVSAVRNGRIIDDIDKDVLNRPTPRIVQAMEKLSDEVSRMEFP